MLEKFFKRREFSPCPENTSVLFAFFAQHFTHQFFKTDYYEKSAAHTWGHHGVDVSSLYGNDVERENWLRSFKDGKLKSQVILKCSYKECCASEHLVKDTVKAGIGVALRIGVVV